MNEPVNVTFKKMANWTYNCNSYTQVVNITRYTQEGDEDESQTVTEYGILAPTFTDSNGDIVNPVDDGQPKYWHSLFSVNKLILETDSVYFNEPAHRSMRFPISVDYGGLGGYLTSSFFSLLDLPFVIEGGTPAVFLPKTGIFGAVYPGTLVEYGDIWDYVSIENDAFEASGRIFQYATHYPDASPGPYAWKHFDFDIRIDITTHYDIP